MDILYVSIAAVFFLATWGLTVLFGRLYEGGH
jgi:hypothetical protein